MKTDFSTQQRDRVEQLKASSGSRPLPATEINRVPIILGSHRLGAPIVLGSFVFGFLHP